jgi:Tfp pilus assembly protein PilV
MNTPTRHTTRRQRGATLLEALIAFLVLALGMLAVTRVQANLRLHADIARQRSEAVRLAQEDIEAMRAFATLAASAGARSFEAIASASRTVDASSGYASNTRYLVQRRIDAAGTLQAKTAAVTVSWADRSGAAQQVALHSVIAGIDPAFSAALGLARSGVSVKGPFGRSITIPRGAKDLGNGSSAFKPVSGGSIALVFNNSSGLVTGRCTGIAAATTTRDLRTSDLASCDANVGYLLSGTVRFSSASPPDAAQGSDVPPAFTIAIALSGSGYPSAPDCSVEAMKTVRYTAAGGLHIEAVPIGATAASMGLPGWAETGERHAAYHCVVYPLASGQWSGRTTIVPTGWTLGSTAADQRVCRYTTDLDSSGAIDANIEHPASYAGVDGTLANQNFLVVKGSENCPSGHATQVAGNNTDVFVDLSTAPHQP